MTIGGRGGVHYSLEVAMEAMVTAGSNMMALNEQHSKPTWQMYMYCTSASTFRTSVHVLYICQYI